MMVAVRSEVSMMEDLGTIDNKAQMIWTVLQCHALIDKFVALDFKGHTSMIQQMTLYMMTERVDPGEMAKQKVTVEKAHVATQSVVEQVKTLTEKFNLHVRNFGDLKHSFDNYKGRGGANAKV